MGKMIGGAHGSVSGKVGKTVSYMLNGKNVIRTIGENKKKPSKKQLAVRQAMKLVTDFLSPLVPVINVGFKFSVLGTDRNPHNEAVSYNTRNSIAGEYPELYLDFGLIKLSCGELDQPLNPTVTETTGGLEFKWETPDLDQLSRKRDRAMLVAYFPELKKASYITLGAMRSEGKDFLELPAKMINKNFEAYIAFIAADADSVSNSVYCQKI